MAKPLRTKDGIKFSRLPQNELKFVRKIRKALGKEASDPKSPIWHDMYKDLMPSKNTSFASQAASFSQITLLQCLVIGKWTSIYINSVPLFDFLKNSNIRQTDLTSIYHTMLSLYLNKQEECMCGHVLHIPNEKESIFFRIFITPKNYSYTVNFVFSRNGRYVMIEINLTEHNGIFGAFENKQDQETFNIILNTFLYMEAFPDFTRDGVPEMSIGIGDGKKQRTLTASQEIKAEYERSLVTPHMRRGHFRMLQSERFKNKRGQVVYVRPTMVAGKAKTVEEA